MRRHRVSSNQTDITLLIVPASDPPRAGLHIKTLKAIRACEQIDRLVYVSCNQNALIADAANLCRSVSTSMTGTPFVPVKAIAVDMFPHTEHCEVVVLFERMKGTHNNNSRTGDEIKN